MPTQPEPGYRNGFLFARQRHGDFSHPTFGYPLYQFPSPYQVPVDQGSSKTLNTRDEIRVRAHRETTGATPRSTSPGGFTPVVSRCARTRISSRVFKVLFHRFDVKSRHAVVWRTETHFDIGSQAVSKWEIGTRVRRNWKRLSNQ